MIKTILTVDVQKQYLDSLDCSSVTEMTFAGQTVLL